MFNFFKLKGIYIILFHNVFNMVLPDPSLEAIRFSGRTILAERVSCPTFFVIDKKVQV